MFINEVVTSPILVEGRKFIERTINSEFKNGKASITTTYMDGKPLLKKYSFSNGNQMKNVWKKVENNKLDIII
jgi:hypothetical protein